jgi:hypothetical protein
MPGKDDDPTHNFLIHADRILQEAQFIIDSIPNAEKSSVERALRQLNAIHLILSNLNDPWLTASEIDGYMDTVLSVFKYSMIPHHLLIMLALQQFHHKEKVDHVMIWIWNVLLNYIV